MYTKSVADILLAHLHMCLLLVYIYIISQIIMNPHKSPPPSRPKNLTTEKRPTFRERKFAVLTLFTSHRFNMHQARVVQLLFHAATRAATQIDGAHSQRIPDLALSSNG